MTGGRAESGHYTSTTELLTQADRHWRTVGRLPSGRSGLAAVNIDNRVLLAGGNDGEYLDEILEYDSHSGEWSLLAQDRLLEPRFGLAVSTVHWDTVEQYC